MTAFINIAKPENISETELQLSTKLEAILKRPPKRHHSRAEVAQKQALENDQLENFAASVLNYKLLSHPTQPDSIRANTPDHGSQDDQTGEPVALREGDVSDKPIETDDLKASVPPPQDLHLSTLIKTTRRARYRDGVRQVGSWVITLAVTGFITCCVAIMLLGLPTQLNPTTWISAHVTPQEAPTPVSATKVQTLEVKPAQQ